MAKAWGRYIAKLADGSQEELCFVCATRKTVAGLATRVHFQTDGYAYTKCECCDEFIEDTIDI